jgi:hypothetical protein
MSQMQKMVGYVKLSAHPRHYAQNGSALEVLKKLPQHAGDAPSHAPVGTPLEIL